MRTLGITSSLILGAFLAYAGALAGASFGGFGGEAPMIVAAVVAILVWGTFAGLAINGVRLAVALIRRDASRLASSLAWTSALYLTAAVVSVSTAFVLGGLAFASCGPLWLANLYHWGGLVASVLAFAAWYSFPLVVRACVGRSQGRDHARPFTWWAPVVTGGIVYGLWAIVWLVLWLVLRGSIDASTYPTRASSPYRLPFPGGESSWVIQGNDSSLNHKGGEGHAWDFRRRCGTPVLAARDGTVSNVIDTNSGGGSNNEIAVRHSDNTVARYLHIQSGSAVVTNGATVGRGAQLASVGNVGNSLTGHIHFVVERGGRSIPITFGDVSDDEGIPRTFSSYTSGNR